MINFFTWALAHITPTNRSDISLPQISAVRIALLTAICIKKNTFLGAPWIQIERCGKCLLFHKQALMERFDHEHTIASQMPTFMSKKGWTWFECKVAPATFDTLPSLVCRFLLNVRSQSTYPSCSLCIWSQNNAIKYHPFFFPHTSHPTVKLYLSKEVCFMLHVSVIDKVI